jgi:hypothetical protein
MQIGQLLLASQWRWWTILQRDLAKITQEHYEIQKSNEIGWWWEKHKPWTMQCKKHNDIKYKTQREMKMM